MNNKNIIIAFGTLVTAGLLLSACVKEKGKEVGTEDFNIGGKASVQVFNGVLSSNRTFVYVDANPVNGATIAYAAPFPSTPANFAITSGYKTFLIKDTLASSAQPQLSFAENLESGKYYTIFAYDTLTTPKQKIVVNNIMIPSDTTSRVRFANFIFSKTAVPAVDIFSVKRNANVFTNIQVTQVTDFIPYASSLNDTLYVRETGTTNLLSTLNGFNPVQKRSYTLVFRGRYQTTGTTGIARLLSVMANN